jgi:formyl-CoA transferase
VVGHRPQQEVRRDRRAPAEGQDLLKRLVASADILVENFRPGTMEKWGLGYEELSRINPRLIMVRVSGYGQTGPYSGKAGYGSIGEAMGGLRYVVGDPSTPPSRMGISIGDTLAATFACMGALMALHHRERTGRGQVVDSAIYESVLAVMETLVTDFDFSGIIRERTGAILPKVAPSNVYPTADGVFVLIAANQDTVFARLAEAMGRPELARDPRFSNHTARGERLVELDDLISQWTATMDAQTLGALLDQHGVPRGDIYRAPDMLADEHFKARRAIVEVMHPVLGQLRMQNVAPRLSETPGAVVSTGPALGEHNTEVLCGLLGLDPLEADRLAEAGIVGRRSAEVARR